MYIIYIYIQYIYIYTYIHTHNAFHNPEHDLSTSPKTLPNLHQPSNQLRLSKRRFDLQEHLQAKGHPQIHTSKHRQGHGSVFFFKAHASKNNPTLAEDIFLDFPNRIQTFVNVMIKYVHNMYIFISGYICLYVYQYIHVHICAYVHICVY